VFVVVAVASALGLQAQIMGAPLTFDGALRMALHQNTDLEAVGRQGAIRDAQRTRDAAHLRGPAIADAGCPLACAGVTRALDGCAADAAPALVTTGGGLLTDGEVAAAAQTLRRNLRQAFYDVLLHDEAIEAAQGVLDFANQLRVTGRSPSDAETTVDVRLDALRVEIARSRATIDLIRAQSDRRAAQAAFNVILNRAPYVPVTLTGNIAEPVALPRLEPAIRLAKAVDLDLIHLRHDLDVQRRARASVPPALQPGARPQGTTGSALRRTAADRESSPVSRSSGETRQADGRIVQLDTERAARERAVEGCLHEEFARIDAEQRAAARFENAVIPAADELVRRTAEEFRSGHVAVRELLEAEHMLVSLRREYLQVLHDLRLNEADVEERLPAPGLPV
jgi:hypothetical protein